MYSPAATVVAGCAATQYVRIVEPIEDQAAYLRIAGIFSQLLPEMDVIDKEKYDFFVSDDEELNAFALSDHTIVVNRGLLHTLNDVELTCILAHEIAHISLGHNARRDAVKYSRELVFAELNSVAPMLKETKSS